MPATPPPLPPHMERQRKLQEAAEILGRKHEGYFINGLFSRVFNMKKESSPQPIGERPEPTAPPKPEWDHQKVYADPLPPVSSGAPMPPVKPPKQPFTPPEINEGDHYVIVRKNGEYVCRADIPFLIKFLEAIK